MAGPTAVGKTDVAIKLAQRLGTAIISADSRQCYREMSIGTAKPSPEELAAVKHYFVGESSVTESISAAGYEARALGYLDEIFLHADSAVVCGGTGLYIKALCEGLDEMPATDDAVLAATEAAYKEHGMEWLQQAVQAEDPAFYAVGEISNPARLLRVLSFIRSTGKSILDYRSGAIKQRPFTIIKIGLDLPRELLYSKINSRVDAMMTLGLLDEVKQLLPYKEYKNLQTVGYSELFAYLAGACTLDEAVEKIKQHTRNYAKRQLTWFRKDKDINWLRADATDVVEQILSLG